MLTILASLLAFPILLRAPCTPPTSFNTVGSALGTAEIYEIPSERYLIIYQDIQHESRATTNIDTQLVLEGVRQQLRGQQFKWGVLDWEDPHFGLINGKGSAEQHSQAVKQLRTVLLALKAEFPHIRWTVWGAPELPFWTNGAMWSALPETDARIAINSALNNWYPVLECCDWLMPWVYDIYLERSMPKAEADRYTQGQIAWVKAKVSLCQQFLCRSGRWVPIIPCVCPFATPNESTKSGVPLTIAEFVTQQVDPVIDAGANGVSLWSALDWWLPSAFSPDSRDVDRRKEQLDNRASVTRAFGGADWSDLGDRIRTSQMASKLIGDCLRVANGRFKHSPTVPLNTSKEN